MSRPHLLAVLAAIVVLVASACGGGDTVAPPSTLPGELVPIAAATATVTVAVGSTSSVVESAVVAKAVPLRVRRAFDAREPLASYGLDPPRATITFALGDGTTIVLDVGDDEFDQTATYVRRIGNERIWLVLDDSLRPLLGPAGASSS
ncbi:MAG: DUF4340 domain-containing protein [Acidimicrobiales bacterium]